MEDKNISVIIPSFKRAHLLDMTIPSYIQPQTLEVIIVDDCSPDNTRDVVSRLMKKYPIIRYIRNDVNKRQPATNNVGLEHVKGKYVYFGDDDAFITHGTLGFLRDTIEKYDADGCMARPISANECFDWDQREKYIQWRLPRKMVDSVAEIYDVSNLWFAWDNQLPYPIEVPCCHASALVKSNLAKACRFDPNFKGCAYREESDFFFRLSIDYGAKLMYDPRGVQMNLPPSMSWNSGAREGGFEVWRKSAIECNRYFLEKNWTKIAEKYSIDKSIEQMDAQFRNELPLKMARDSWGKSILKKIYFKLFVYR